MTGDERVRRCPSCNKNVYNVTLMRRRELDQLIAETEGALPCVRAYRRPDGTLVTRDCMVPLLRAASWVRLKVAVLASFLLALWSDVALARVRPPLSRPSCSAPATTTAGATKPDPKSKPAPRPKAPPRKTRRPNRSFPPSRANGGLVLE
jgi:hypothetical protein